MTLFEAPLAPVCHHGFSYAWARACTSTARPHRLLVRYQWDLPRYSHGTQAFLGRLSSRFSRFRAVSEHGYVYMYWKPYMIMNLVFGKNSGMRLSQGHSKAASNSVKLKEPETKLANLRTEVHGSSGLDLKFGCCLYISCVCIGAT